MRTKRTSALQIREAQHIDHCRWSTILFSRFLFCYFFASFWARIRLETNNGPRIANACSWSQASPRWMEQIWAIGQANSRSALCVWSEEAQEERNAPIQLTLNIIKKLLDKRRQTSRGPFSAVNVTKLCWRVETWVDFGLTTRLQLMKLLAVV